MFRAHLNLPPTAADKIAELTGETEQLRYRADHVMDEAVEGARGQLISVGEAKDRAAEIGEKIDIEEEQGSHRHRRVSLATKFWVLLVVAVIDFPIMGWLAGSVFNVDWGGALADNYLAVALSLVVSVLATGGATLALHHVGREQRQYKTHSRHLAVSTLTVGAKMAVCAVTVLVLAIAGTAFYRVWLEGYESGLADLAFLLASLVALVMLISSWLVFLSAFRDGSPEQDDLLFYSRLVRPYLRTKAELEARIQRLEQQRGVLVRRARPAPESGPNGSSAERTDEWGIRN